MKKLFTIFVLFFVLTGAGQIFSQVSISGDARFRPRLDIDDRTDANGSISSDFYYMYRMRLNVNANIGDGYFAKAMLAHNGVAYYGKFSTGMSADLLGSYGREFRENGKRMSVDFMELNAGRSTENFGYKIGLFTVGSFTNSIYDVHFFPASIIDVPFLILNTDGAYGATTYFSAGAGKLTISAFVDDNMGIKIESAAGDVTKDTRDQYSFYGEYAVPMGGFKLQPMLLYTYAYDSSAAPLTFGVKLDAPKVGNFNIGGSFIYSMQSKTDAELSSAFTEYGMLANEYNIWKLRGRITGSLGPGSLTFFADYAQRTDMFSNKDDAKTNFLYTWLAYTIKVYSGEHGEFSITPEWRHLSMENDDAVLRAREKIELNFDFKFN